MTLFAVSWNYDLNFTNFFLKMWKCHKCNKPVYFAERKQSLGYDWHPECLRCEECGKRLNPGQHAEHKGVPYCHIPCYGALFGPQLFGHGTRVESHTSFGKVENRTGSINLPRSHLESKLKVYNQYLDGKSGEIRSREVNGRLVLEGALRIYWGVLGVIHLKEDDDQRTVVTVRKRNSYKDCLHDTEGTDVDDDAEDSGVSNTEPQKSSCESSSEGVILSDIADAKVSYTFPAKIDMKQDNWDELDDFLQVERKLDEADGLYQTMPEKLSRTHNYPYSESFSQVAENNEGQKNSSTSNAKDLESERKSDEDSDDFEKCENCSCFVPKPNYAQKHGEYIDCSNFESVDNNCGGVEKGVLHKKPAKYSSSAIKRRSGRKRSRTKLRRRCSINGHFYNRETSFFTPPHGSVMSVWVTSLVSTQEVINLLLEKYKVDSNPSNFALFVIRDNGEQRRIKDDEYPLVVRVMLGPHEDVAKLYLMDRQNTEEITNEVAQFLNLSLTECRAILQRYQEEEEREVARVYAKYFELGKRIQQRMKELKVRL